MNKETQIIGPKWILVKTDQGVHLEDRNGKTYGPDDEIQFHPSWNKLPARRALRRSVHEGKLLDEFCGAKDPPKDAHIHLRVPMEKKNQFVKSAQSEGKKLTEWILKKLE